MVKKNERRINSSIATFGSVCCNQQFVLRNPKLISVQILSMIGGLLRGNRTEQLSVCVLLTILSLTGFASVLSFEDNPEGAPVEREMQLPEFTGKSGFIRNDGQIEGGGSYYALGEPFSISFHKDHFAIMVINGRLGALVQIHFVNATGTGGLLELNL